MGKAIGTYYPIRTYQGLRQIIKWVPMTGRVVRVTQKPLPPTKPGDPMPFETPTGYVVVIPDKQPQPIQQPIQQQNPQNSSSIPSSIPNPAPPSFNRTQTPSFNRTQTQQPQPIPQPQSIPQIPSTIPQNQSAIPNPEPPLIYRTHETQSKQKPVTMALMITESIKLKRFIDLLDKMYNYSVEFPDQHLFQLFSQTLTNVSKDLYNFYIAHGKSDTDVRNHIKDVYNNVMQKYNEGYVPFEDLITFD